MSAPVVACRDAPPILDPAEHVLDLVALAIELLVVRPRFPAGPVGGNAKCDALNRPGKAGWNTSYAVGLSGEVSYAFDLAGIVRFAPLVKLEAGWPGHDGFTEAGAGAVNLTSGAQGWNRLDVGLGVALTHSFATGRDRVTLEGRAVWEHAFADAVPGQSQAQAGSPTGFSVHGPMPAATAFASAPAFPGTSRKT